MTRGRTAKSLIAALLPVLVVSCTQAPKADYPAAPVPFTDVHLTDAFWAPRLETNRTVTIPHVFKQSEESGRVKNFDLAAAALEGATDGKYCSRYPFDDSDIYKTIEAASYALATHPDPELAAYVDGLIAKIAAAQEPDGYLYAARTIGGPPPQPWLGKERWSHLYMSHELYNVGHLYEAAAAHAQATGKKNLLDIAVKSANLVAREFGPGKRTNPPGHEEIEIGLVKLYRVTGTRKYLDLAKFFIDARGKTEGRIPFVENPREGKEQLLYGEYAQDHKPFIEQTEAVGHAVRAGYLYAGAADVAALTGDAAYIAALDKIWADMAGTKLYITGGIGAAGGWEGYGPPYRLPNLSAYAETCANIATFLWNSRMQRLELDAKYADVMERILYNGVLSGISLSGDLFLLSQSPGLVRPARAGAVVQLRLLPAQRGPHPDLGAGLFLRRLGRPRLRQPLRPGNRQDEGRRDRSRARPDDRLPLEGRYQDRGQTREGRRFHPGRAHPRLGDEPSRPLRSLHLHGAGRRDRRRSRSTARPCRSGLIKDTRSSPGRGRPATSSSFQPAHAGPPGRRQRSRRGRPRPGRRRARPARLLRRVDRQRRPGREPRAGRRRDARGRSRGRTCSAGSSFSRAKAEAVSEKAGKIVVEKKPVMLIPYYAWANRGKGEMAVWLAREPGKARIVREPGLSAKAVVTASERAVNPKRANDQFEPESSDDAAGYMHWWPKRGTAEWIDYTFETPVRVSESSVYWFDDTGGGGCRVPASWRILYKTGEDWVPVKPAGAYGVAKDAWNTVKFTPVRTKALRLEVQLQESWSAGVHEWRIK